MGLSIAKGIAQRQGGDITALGLEGDKIRFLLSDNGAGMAITKLNEGFGLRGMSARAEALGGSVRFETEEGEGFEIHITLPADSVKNDKKG